MATPITGVLALKFVNRQLKMILQKLPIIYMAAYYIFVQNCAEIIIYTHHKLKVIVNYIERVMLLTTLMWNIGGEKKELLGSSILWRVYAKTWQII